MITANVAHGHSMRALMGASLLLLAACSGGGSSGSNGGGTGGGGGAPTPTPTAPAPTPAPTGPKFTSAANVSVAENVTGAFYSATASDPQNDPVTFDIFGGPDAGAFSMSSGGQLLFNKPPNYDLPADANGDNSYQVTLRARAGGEQATLDLTIGVANEFEGIKVTRVATGLNNPVGIAPFFSDLKFVIAEKTGKIFEFDGETGALTELGSVESAMKPGEILDVIYYFDGDARSQGIITLTHSSTDGLLLQGVNRENGKTYSRKLAQPWSEPVKAALFVSDRTNQGGSIMAAIGDPGGTLAQDSGSSYGKLFEIGGSQAYAGASIPSGLWYQVDMIGDGIQAPDGGGILFGQTILVDRGSDTAHEITPFDYDRRPLDFGWPYYEGATVVRPNPPVAVNGPSLVYEFGTGKKQGRGIVAGVGYAGGIPGIDGHYVFGDKDGKIWSIPATLLDDGILRTAASIENRTEDFAPNAGKIDSPVAFAIAFQRIFILDSDGEIFRVDAR